MNPMGLVICYVLKLGVIVTTRIFAIFQEEDPQKASVATITGTGYNRRNCEATVLLFFWQCLRCVDWDDLHFGCSDVLFSDVVCFRRERE